MGFTNDMVAVLSDILMEPFPEVLYDPPCHLRWNCVNFLSDSFLQILKSGKTFSVYGIRPVPPLYHHYSLHAAHS